MHRAFRAFRWYRDTTRWQLSSTVALLSTSYVLSMACANATIIALYRPHPRNWQEGATAGMQVFQGALLAVASLGYIYVSSKAPRSGQLHFHGFALLMRLTSQPSSSFSEASFLRGYCASASATEAVTDVIFAAVKASISMMIKKKMSLLGRQTACYVKSNRWGYALVVSAIMSPASSAMLYVWATVLVLRGMTCEDLDKAYSGDTMADGVHPADAAVGFFFTATAIVGSLGLVIAGTAVVYVANRLRQHAVRKLVERQVHGVELAKVQRTLRHHVLGMLVSITSTQAVVAAAFLDGLNLLGDGGDSQEEFVKEVGSTLDIVGDVAGILLLSGIGTLLVQEDPEAGDISGHIRGILHSAVLTTQAEMAFEGRVDANVRSGVCVVSFPGKFLGDWHSLTWACEQGDLCSACVFLPKADTLRRFGQHETNPETGKCWCHSLYGEEKPWGCLWFTVWKKNVDLAAELGLELIAVFFPGQAGKGIVEWDGLGKADLWDGVGLGGSQKSEVAYMKKQGFQLTEVDLETFRLRVHPMSPSASTSIAVGTNIPESTDSPESTD